MRPITAGMISVRQALILGFSLCLIAFALVLTLNRYAIYLSFVALGLALIYPLMKRITSLPQAVLGLAFNFGLIMAYGALQNHIPSVAWLFYAAALCWTIAYDTWYALEDISDDIKIGVKSSARLFGARAQTLIALLQAMSLVLFAWAGWRLGCNGYYYCALLICIPLYAYQHHLAQHKAYIPAFNHNHWVGLVIFIGILLQN
jgi:4-hydroxybenzoate polyprenyltransferase